MEEFFVRIFHRFQEELPKSLEVENSQLKGIVERLDQTIPDLRRRLRDKLTEKDFADNLSIELVFYIFSLEKQEWIWRLIKSENKNLKNDDLCKFLVAVLLNRGFYQLARVMGDKVDNKDELMIIYCRAKENPPYQIRSQYIYLKGKLVKTSAFDVVGEYLSDPLLSDDLRVEIWREFQDDIERTHSFELFWMLLGYRLTKEGRVRWCEENLDQKFQVLTSQDPDKMDEIFTGMLFYMDTEKFMAAKDDFVKILPVLSRSMLHLTCNRIYKNFIDDSDDYTYSSLSWSTGDQGYPIHTAFSAFSRVL